MKHDLNLSVPNISTTKYSDDEKRKIMGVRYSMTIADFSVSYPYTFAEEIPT